jgi:hypothetical protein
MIQEANNVISGKAMVPPTALATMAVDALDTENEEDVGLIIEYAV